MECFIFQDSVPQNLCKTKIYEDSRKDLSFFVSGNASAECNDREVEDIALFLAEQNVQINGVTDTFPYLLGLYVRNNFDQLPKAMDAMIHALQKDKQYCILFNETEIQEYRSEKIQFGKLLEMNEIHKCFAGADCMVFKNRILVPFDQQI